MNKFKRRLAAGLVALLAFIGILAGTEAPAQAAGSCPSGYACFYEHVGYAGSSTWYSTGFRGQCVTLYGFWHDRISSFQNNIGADIIMYRNAYCNPDQGSFWYWNGGSVGDLNAWGWNDTIDSIYFYP